MTTYISILRGINVSGKNRLKMDALRLMYAGLGYIDIQSYIQSGNVIFQTVSVDAKLLETTISTKIFETFGLLVPVLVLTLDELKIALNNNPYVIDSAKDPVFMHLTFLSDFPDNDKLNKISGLDFSPDEVICLGKVIYLYCPKGYGITKLNNSFFEKKLKLTATTRNLRTATELLIMAEKN